MDAKILYELKFEMDRIYVNGIRLAKNNQRIAKILPILEKHMDEDTAYSNLVSNLYELKRLTAFNFIERLSGIHASLDYLLRLHGETVMANEEKMRQIPVFNINEITTPQYSFLELKPLLDALKGIGKDQPDIIRKAREQKLFDDFRTYPYLNNALANEENEIVELVENIITEDLKDKMIPFLLNGFKPDDKKDNLRRLALLYELRYEDMEGLFKEILKGDAAAMQVKVVQYMSANAAYQDQIIELSENPQKHLKEIALRQLANMKNEKAERKLCELFAKAIRKKNKGDIELLAKALSQTELQYVFDDVLGQIKGFFNNLLEANKKTGVDHFNMLRLGILILKQKDRPEVYDFYLDILLNDNYNEIINKKKTSLAKPAKIISYAIGDATQGMEPGRFSAFYKKIIDNMAESEWKLPFYKMYLSACIRRGDSAGQIYETFSPYYLKKNISVDDLAVLYGIDESGQVASTIDSRWINLLYHALERVDEEENIETLLLVLNALEPALSERFNEELIKAGEKTKKHLLEITSMIMKRDVKDKYEVVYSLIKICHDQGPPGSNALRQLPRATYWDEFPETYAAKFQNLKNAPKAIYTKIADKKRATHHE